MKANRTTGYITLYLDSLPPYIALFKQYCLTKCNLIRADISTDRFIITGSCVSMGTKRIEAGASILFRIYFWALTVLLVIFTPVDSGIMFLFSQDSILASCACSVSIVLIARM